MTDIFNGYGIEVKLKSEDDFLKIRETLTRIGIASNKDKKLYQSCHILHKKGRYAIVHFKELFALDGRKSTMDEVDTERRNVIARLLHEWGLCVVVGSAEVQDAEGNLVTQYPTKMQFSATPGRNIKIIPHGQKSEWELISKYSIGKKPF